MSRIGKQPIAIPSGVEVSVEGNVLKFKKGAHLKELDTKGHVDVKIEDAHIVFSPKSDEKLLFASLRSTASVTKPQLKAKCLSLL